MRSIDIDFDVFKEITARRQSEDVNENDVLRQLLGLNPINKKIIDNDKNQHSWIVKNIKFPPKTLFRASYKGKYYEGIVEENGLKLNTKIYTSPSAAAISITNNPVNGWVFWECQLPGQSNWQIIKNLRKK